MKNKSISTILLSSAIALTGTIIANAEMVFTGSAEYYNDPSYGGTVFKIGYAGTGSGTLAKGKTWTMNENLLIGCCPNNYEPSYFYVYGTANTQKNVYVSAISRSGHCYVDGGTWNCGGQFQLGQQTIGYVTLQNSGTLKIGNSFRINQGSTVTVKDESSLILTIDANGSFGEIGGFHIYAGSNNSITLDRAQNLVIDASGYTGKTDELILRDFVIGNSNIKTKLSALNLTVNGNTFSAEDESALNQHLGGITVLGYEGYAKRFVVDSENQSVSLHLSMIPEPSSFGLLASLGGLALAISRRRRR